MASTSTAGAERNDSLTTKPPDSDNPNETTGINLPAAQNRKISFLEKVETIGSPTAQEGTNGQTPDTHDAEITRKQSIPPPSQPPKSVLKQRRPSVEGVDWIAPSPGGAPSSARPPKSIPPSSLTSPLPTPPLPDPGYYTQRFSAPSPLTASSGPSPYFSPPISWLPSHMRRGRKSVPNSTGRSPSMLQECFSAENSPYYMAPSLTPGFGAADLPRDGRGFEQEVGRAGASPEYLLFASGRSRLTGVRGTMHQDPEGERSIIPPIVVWHLRQTSSPQEAEDVLSDLLHATRMGDIDPRWITALGSSGGLLRDLFRLTDQVTPVDSVLNPKSPCAEMINLLVEHGHIDSLLTQVCRPDRNGATGIRHLICKARSMGNPPGEPFDQDLRARWAVDSAACHAYQIAYMSGADSRSMVPAIRLVESILPSVRTLEQLQRPIYRSFLKAVIQLIKNKELVRRAERPEVNPARRTAALHLISSTLRTYKLLLDRLEAEADIPTMPEKEWILEELGIADIVPYLQDERSHPLVRCMALRVLRDFADVDVEELPRWERLEDILAIAVEVLLWRTKWQHGHEATSKSLDIAKFCPHDDAYRIITSSPAELVIPILSKALKADDKSALLEPLLSLIVDHSRLKDKYWPFMLSILLHCGCLLLFYDILLPPVPPEKDFLYRKTCRTKTDACIGLTRCFEQMRAKDVRTIPSNVGATLVKLANDEQLPLNLRGQAGGAFGALKENIPTLLEMPLEAPRPLNNKLDSTLRSRQSASPPTEATLEPQPTALQSSTPMPVPEPVEEDQHEIERDKHGSSPRSGPQPEGISKRQVVAFPDAEEVTPHHPQVKSHLRGEYPDNELGLNRIDPRYRYPGPSSRFPSVDKPGMSTSNSRRIGVNSVTDEGEPKVFSVAPPREPTAVGRLTRNLTSRPGTAELWHHAPQNFQSLTSQAGAAAVETPRIGISNFDKDFKTPRTIFEPIGSSDESSIYNPNSPDQQFYSLSGATPGPQYAGLPGSEDDDEEPAPFTGGSSSGFIPPRIPSGPGGSMSRFVRHDVQRGRSPVQPVVPTFTGHRPARKPESVMNNTPRVSVHSINDEDEPTRDPTLPPPSPPLPVRRGKGKAKGKSELERNQRFLEQQDRIRLLEEELERQRQEPAEEKRRFEEIETERYEFHRNWDEERDAAVQQQLGDLSNRLQDHTMEARRWRELDEQRIHEAEIRRAEETERTQELHDLVHSIIADREEEKRRAEEERLRR
ncbi:hypothetical protein FRC04_000025 [Tulasnella sp. 424]|nr:hypothetical protein FRC04_000025 [Tulasnella sp. 424]KAG8981889.1 hypothetical protein FRC05_000031 [Tulasnella sp. 425]